MSNDSKIRWGWIQFMYIYTIVGAGGFGLGMIFAPGLIKSLFKFPSQDPIIFGAYASMLVSSGLLAVLGLRSPLKFVPLLLFQLFYKSIWFIGVVLPFILANDIEFYVILLSIIFASYIIGDLIAIPFSYIRAREPA